MFVFIFFEGLETQLGPVVAAISKNKSIKKLNIGRNLNSIKSKHVYHVMEAVVQMIQVRSLLSIGWNAWQTLYYSVVSLEKKWQ